MSLTILGAMRVQKPKLLGIAASLRNARWGSGNRHLIDQLRELPDKPALLDFLKSESELHLGNFIEAGRKEGLNFLEIYKNLAKSNGASGLSNSEIGLAAALWAAQDKGCAVSHLSLAEFFDANGTIRGEDVLREALSDADGFIVSGPVYFGDRGSLAESLIEFIARDADLQERLRGKIYGGIAIGAKRNGGQETTLIYQMLDMLGLGLVAVGNDSDTTAQYGGTGHAGDVGTMHRDIYGIDTSMGLGRRIANVIALNEHKNTQKLADPPKALFLILQDADGIAASSIDELISRLSPHVHATVIDLASKKVKRCLACDICPTHIDTDDIYRCIIKSTNDDLSDLHGELLNHDLLVPVVASVRDRSRVKGNYQTFNERSRYIRRGDYIWSDLVVAPITFTESAGYDTFSIRQMTSFLRHHTIMTQPLVGRIAENAVVDFDAIERGMRNALSVATSMAIGRLSVTRAMQSYNPVGYVLSAEKEAEDIKMEHRRTLIAERQSRRVLEAEMRLRTSPAHP